MKKKLPIIAIALLFLTGIAIMFYPMISSMINNYANRQESVQYEKVVEEIKDDEMDEFYRVAEHYNKALTQTSVITDPFDERAYRTVSEEYEATLNVGGNGLIGYVEVPCIDVFLPIYHGTSEEILSKGAGHVQNTSLPIGGANTHAVISAHTGYPTQTFFDYLVELKEGDEFFVSVLGERMRYVVDKITVITPDKTDDLRIIDGEDYVTLLTCTPYGLNTHRLLVRGKRAPIVEEEKTTPEYIHTYGDYMYIFGQKIPYWLMATVLAGAVILVVIIIIIAGRRRKKKASQKHLEGNSSTDEADSGGER